MRKGLTAETRAVEDIFHRTDVLWLALADADGPYCVPLNFAHKGNTLYVHSGMRGRKYEALCSGAPLSFSCAADMERKDGKEDACDYGYRFKSVVGFGVPRKLQGEEARSALDVLTLKFAGEPMPYKEKALAATAVFAIDMDSVTARLKE